MFRQHATIAARKAPENAPITVNVFANDTPGADGVNLTSGVAVIAGTLTGAGSLAYNNDGTFTYTPAPGEEGVVTFRYTITDGDGDTSPATVTITLLADSVPFVDVAGDSEVEESGLPARGDEPSGSNSDAPSEVAIGTIATGTGNDTLASLVINGTNVTAGGTVAGTFGTLVVTLTDGVYSYRYTLSDNTLGDATSDSFTVVITDSDGDSADDILLINIVDDVPTARDDSGTQAPENAPITVNVFANDTPGADGVNLTSGVAVIAGTLTGAGSLAYNNDGTFTYTPAPGEEGVVTFRYTITDGDGDTSPATVTITLLADSVPFVDVAGDSEVEESGLPARGDEPAGSNSDAPSEVAIGTIATGTGNDTLASLVINGTNVSAGGTVAGTFGTLVVTLTDGAYSYRYTLSDNTLGDATSDSFNVVITDSDGDSADDILLINIVDDVPTARDDSGTQAPENAPITVNVFANDTPGADGVNLTSGVAVIAGTLTGAGSLAYNNDGTFTYTPAPGEEGVVTFRYTITDGDGDTSPATVTITLLADSVPFVDVAGDSEVEESGLPARGDEPAGSNSDAPSEVAIGTIATGTGNDTLASLVINGTNVTAGGTVAGTFGTLVVTLTDGVYSYRYTLSDNTLGDATSDSFTVVITDSDGDSADDILLINIVDDVPMAFDDTDTVLNGSSAAAIGNVITDDENDGGEDTQGADGVTVTAISGLNVGTVGGTTNGSYGVLEIDAEGNYSYVRNDGTPGNVEDIFTYQITDADGDISTATLTIFIEDARPLVGVNATVLLDDDALANGNPDGVGDDVNAANVTGTLSGSGGDGALTWAFQLTGAPSGFTYVAGANGSVLVQQGSITVLTITLNGATGAYTVTQNAPILHANGNDENNQGFTLNYSVTDVDNDSTPGVLSINVDDDTPVVLGDGEAPSLSVDETIFGTNDTENLSSLFTTPVDYGADGAGSVSYALAVVAGASNLVDTLTGNPVVLSLEAGVVFGRVGGVEVFRVIVDGSGNVTLDQSRAVVHTPNGGPDDVATLLSNLVTLTQTVTDRDGDSAAATVNIGGMLQFVDDAPSAGANLAVQLDDDSLGGNAGGTGDVDPNTLNTSGTLTHTFGNDGGSIAFATSGAPAGYRYTPSGSNVLIQQEQGVGNWVTVATVTLNAATGAYTVTQNAAVVHPLGGAENDVSFTLNYTVTDGDLDTAPGTLVINIDDDTPIAVAGSQAGTVDEDGLANGITVAQTGDVAGAALSATGSVTGLFNAGADTPLTYQLSGSTAGLTALGLTSGGVAVTYALVGNVLTASAGATPVFTLTLNTTTGQWDFVLSAPLDHANGASENDITLAFGNLLHATDRDGDLVDAIGSLTITVDDDSPLVSNVTATGSVSVDETSANPGGFPISANSGTAMISATLAYGADGAAVAGTPAYTLAVTGAAGLTSLATSLVTALGGFAITLVEVNATTLAGQYTNGGTQTAFTLSIDAATGVVTLTQNIALEHNTDGVEGAAHNDVLSLAGLVTATVTITDRDGDSHDGSAQVGGAISFFDDGPSITATGAIPALTVDETVLATDAGPVSFAGVFTTNFGADGGTQIAYALGVVAGASGLIDTATGQVVNLVLNGTVVEGRTAGSNALVFTVTVNASGGVTLDQLRAVMHSPDSGPNQSTTLTAANLVTLTATATDNDGDTDSALVNIGQSLVFLDDAPSAGANLGGAVG